DRRGPSVVRRACPRGRAEPRSLPARRGSHLDRRARRPLVGVALRVRGVRGTVEPAADRDLLGSARVAGDRPGISRSTRRRRRWRISKKVGPRARSLGRSGESVQRRELLTKCPAYYAGATFGVAAAIVATTSLLPRSASAR